MDSARGPIYRQSTRRRDESGGCAGGKQTGLDGRTPLVGVFDGPTGAGKSAVLEYLRKVHGASCVVGAKLTTRPRRASHGDWELRFVDEIPTSLREFTYSSVGWQYAVDAADVQHALDMGLSYFTICTDTDVIRTLSRRFPTIVIYVHRLLSPQEVSSLLAGRGTTGSEESRLRTAEVASAIGRYAENTGLYDFVILNVGTVSDLHRQVDAVISACPSRIRTAGNTALVSEQRGGVG